MITPARAPASIHSLRGRRLRAQPSSPTSAGPIAAVSFDHAAATVAIANCERVPNEGAVAYFLAIRMDASTNVVAATSNTPEHQTTASGASGAASTSSPAAMLQRTSGTH